MKHAILIALVGMFGGSSLGCGDDRGNGGGGASSGGGNDGGGSDSGSDEDGGSSATGSDGGSDGGGETGTSTGGGTESGSGGTGTPSDSSTDTAGGSGSGADPDIEEFCTIACDVCFMGNAPWQSLPVDQCIPECIADFEDCPPAEIPAILECTGGPDCPEGMMGFATCLAPYTCLLS